MKSVCVFLGSRVGNDPAYLEAAAATGRELAARNLTCVYGGARTGLMNELAESAKNAGAKVIGVTVQALKNKENFHRNLDELHVLPTMHERKHLMVKLSDAFIALPGGIGTYEEFFEVYTLAKLQFHHKPCGLLNVNGFFTPLLDMLEATEKAGFLSQPYKQSIICATDPATLFDQLTASDHQKH